MSKEIQAECNICKKTYKTNIEDIGVPNKLKMIEKDVRKFYVCRMCREDPKNRDKIIEFIGKLR